MKSRLFSVFLLKNFKGGLHLSRGLTNAYDKSLDTLHSDTIKSALFICTLNLYGGEHVDKSFLESFKISSAFPFFYSKIKKERLYFFPKPEINRLPLDITPNEGKEKKLKKLKYLEKVFI
jgi:CRISPR-associated protein Csm4